MTLLTEEAQTVDRIWWIFFWIAMAVLALVVVLVTWVVLRYRRRDDALPRQVRHHIPIELTYTGIPLLIVAFLAVITVRSLDDLDEPEADDPDVVVEVIGYQWQWRFEYPEHDVVVAGTGIDDRPVLVLPSESIVRFRLTSRDVLHAFWIPEFRFKRDMWPGEIQTFDVRMLDRTGEFPNAGACAEFCGLDHATMRFSLAVVTPEEFEVWLAEQADAGEVAAP